MSVLSQTNLPEEIVILDNGSDDGTREAVEDLIGGAVRWVGADYNHQSLWNFKRAYGMSKKKYFTILHDDDRLLPTFLETVVGILDSDVDLIAITTNGYRIDATGSRTSYNLLPEESTKILYFQNSEEVAIRYSNGFVPFPNIVYRNGFPQKIIIKEEFGKIWDCIFIIDLARYGKIAILDDPLFEYRHHPGQDSSLFPEELLQREEEYIIELTKGHHKHRQISKNIRNCQSKRYSRLIMNSIVKKFNPRFFFYESKKYEYKFASVPCVIDHLLFDRIRYHRDKKNYKTGK